MRSPLVGAVPKTEGLTMTLPEILPGFFSENLLMTHTVDPVWEIYEDYTQKRISSFVAQERLRRVLEHIEEEFGLHYAPTWEQVRDGKFDNFGDIYNMNTWAIYLPDAFDRKILMELVDYEVDVDPAALALAAAPMVDLLILDVYDEDVVYVVKSSAVTRGQLTHSQYLLFDPCVITTDHGPGDVACYGLPEEIAEEADRLENELLEDQERYQASLLLTRSIR